MHQESFFPDLNVPNKIQLVPAFISEAEEASYLARFASIKWQQVRMHGVIAKRRVAHYGLDYTYSKRAVHKGPPAPEWLHPLTMRAANLIGRNEADLKEILVTHYPNGSGIGWHIDAEVFGNSVIGISFLSDCTMKFKNPETNDLYKLFIPRRSAYVFSDEARWKWLHSISNHEHDRYSITFRTLL